MVHMVMDLSWNFSTPIHNFKTLHKLVAKMFPEQVLGQVYLSVFVIGHSIVTENASDKKKERKERKRIKRINYEGRVHAVNVLSIYIAIDIKFKRNHHRT